MLCTLQEVLKINGPLNSYSIYPSTPMKLLKFPEASFENRRHHVIKTCSLEVRSISHSLLTVNSRIDAQSC